MDWLGDFERDGVVVVPQVLDDADLLPVIDEISAWVDKRARALAQRGLITELHEDKPFETRYGYLFGQSPKMQNGLDLMYSRGKAMFRFLHNEALLDVVQQILGPDISCNPIQHLRAKPPVRFEGHEDPGFHNVSWHQDVGVMMAEGEASNILTCWIPLVDVNEDNGCMMAMPGLPETAYIRHVEQQGDTTIDPSLLPDLKPISLDCRRGDLVLMSRFTPHCSTPNRADVCRWSLDCRYQVTGQHTGRTAHPAFSVRGAEMPGFPRLDHAAWCDAWIDAFEHPHGESGHRLE